MFLKFLSKLCRSTSASRSRPVVFSISAVIKLTSRLRLLAFITFLGLQLFLTLISCTIPKNRCDTPSLVWVRLCDLGLCFCPSLCLRSVLSSCPRFYIFYVFIQNTVPILLALSSTMDPIFRLSSTIGTLWE